MATDLAGFFESTLKISYMGTSINDEEKLWINKELDITYENLENFKQDIDREKYGEISEKLRDNSEILPENYDYIKALITSNAILSNLKSKDVSYVYIFESLKNINSERFVLYFEKKFANSIVSKEFKNIFSSDKISSETIKKIEEFSICGNMMKNSSEIQDLKNNLFLSGIYGFDTRTKNIKKITKDIINLKKATEFEYGIVATLINKFFELIEESQKIRKYNSNNDDSNTLLNPYTIGKCLDDLQAFNFNADHKSKFNDFCEEFSAYLHLSRNDSKENVDLSTFYNKNPIEFNLNLSQEDIDKKLPIKEFDQLDFSNSIEVYKGKNTQKIVHVVTARVFDQEVIVKFFREVNLPNIRKSLLEQSKIMCAMSQDEGIVNLYGAFIRRIPKKIKNLLNITTEDQYGILIIEFCDCDLKDYMETIQEKSKREQEALRIGRILIDIMKRLNNNGIKHKDIKPQNILVKKTDQNVLIKITDFDVSTTYEKNSAITEANLTNVVGTTSYAAPEIRKILESNHKGQVKLFQNRADVYSLGITLFEVAVLPEKAIVLNSCQDGLNLESIVMEHIDTDIDNQELKDLLKIMLVFDAEKRWSFRNFPDNSMIINRDTVKTDFDETGECEDYEF